MSKICRFSVTYTFNLFYKSQIYLTILQIIFSIYDMRKMRLFITHKDNLGMVFYKIRKKEKVAFSSVSCKYFNVPIL